MKKMISKAKMAKELAKSRSKLSSDMLKSLREKSSINDMSQPMNDIRRAEFTKAMSEPTMKKVEPVESMQSGYSEMKKKLENMKIDAGASKDMYDYQNSKVEDIRKAKEQERHNKVVEALKESMKQEFSKKPSDINLAPALIQISGEKKSDKLKDFENKVKEAASKVKVKPL